jgi:hypothetical protein
MTVEVILFALRLVSGGLLILFLIVLFALLWRDYRGAVRQIEAARRSYGRLTELIALDEGGAIATGKAYPLLPLTSLGRTPTNSVIVDDDFASGEHCLIALRGGRWWLEDRASRNGTTINGTTISQPVIITDGDIVGIGERRFRIDLEA